MENKCLVCSLDIPLLTPNKRKRKFCSHACGSEWHKRESIASGRSQALQQRASDARASVARPGAIQCAVCLRWYKRPAHHAWQRHGVTAREYKKGEGLALTRGITTQADHDRMRLHALDNGMDKSLQVKGKRTRYTVGDPRARMKSNPWGSKGAPRP